jgi:hypothetical protein
MRTKINNKLAIIGIPTGKLSEAIIPDLAITNIKHEIIYITTMAIERGLSNLMTVS